MKSAIDILKQQFEWVSNNRDECPQSDEYYDGYKEGTKNCLDILRSAMNALGEF